MSGRFSEAMISSKQITPIKLTRGYAPISGSSPWYQIHSWSKEQWSFFTAAIIVVIATIIERFTFKLSADHMSPYRTNLIFVIFLFSIFANICILLIQKVYKIDTAAKPVHFPHYKIMIMSFMDTIQFCFYIIATPGISPIMTLIYLYLSSPITSLGARFIFPNRKYSLIQIIGLICIFIAILTIFVYYYIISRTNTIIPTTVIQSSLLYLLGAVIQGIGTLYKEKTIIDFSQPLDLYYMNCWIFAYGLVFISFLSPLLYMSQGITSTYANYPLNGFLSNIYDGFLCLFGLNPSLDNDHLYSIEDASCPNICWFVIAYVLATVILLQAIDRILKFNDGSLVRILSISIMCSFVFLSLYRIITGTTSSSSSSSSGTEGSQISHSHGLLFSSNDVSIIDIISVIILVLGMELYGRDPEPEIESITNFSPVRR